MLLTKPLHSFCSAFDRLMAATACACSFTIKRCVFMNLFEAVDWLPSYA